MSNPLLKIADLSVAVGNKAVISGLNLEVKQGEVVAIIGANGSGKSSLAMTLLGDSRYNVTTNQLANKPTIIFEGQDLIRLSADERARAGLFVAWQYPVMIPGVLVFNLCKASCEAVGDKIGELVAFKQRLEGLAIRVGLSKGHITRAFNDGFSGGERKRLELLQLLLLKPKLAILDESDSGLDSAGVKILMEITAQLKQEGTSFILITHNKQLLRDKVIDKTWEMKNGQLSTGI